MKWVIDGSPTLPDQLLILFFLFSLHAIIAKAITITITIVTCIITTGL